MASLIVQLKLGALHVDGGLRFASGQRSNAAVAVDVGERGCFAFDAAGGCYDAGVAAFLPARSLTNTAYTHGIQQYGGSTKFWKVRLGCGRGVR